MNGVLYTRAVTLLAILLSAQASVDAQGFGLTKETVSLHRKLPAIFHLEGTAVSVKVTSTAPNSQQIADELTPLLETAMQQNDKRVTIENTSPQTLITCNITSLTPGKIQALTRNNTVLTKKGTQSTPQAYQKVTGAITVAYQARQAKPAKTMDAAVIEVKVNEDYETGGGKTKSIVENMNPKQLLSTLKRKHEAEEAIPANAEDVNQMLLRQLVARIVSRIVTTDETIEVLLAKGKLAESSKLGQSGLWPRMLEATQAVPPFPKKDDEAYRLYNIGVAYEAMGYQTEERKQALKLFEQAAVNYGKAIDGKPDEKYFREPQNRIEQAIVILKTLSERQEAPAVITKQETPVPAVTDAGVKSYVPPVPSAGSDALTNEQIIDLAKSGMDDENLIANIKDARAVHFDLSIGGQKQLMQSGVSNKVLAAMRLKARGPATPVRRPRPPAAAGPANPAAKKE